MNDGFVAILAIMGVMSVPIVAILTNHQRRMAEIVHGSENGEQGRRIVAMEHEIAELRHLMSEQMIVLDDISSAHRRLLERQSESNEIQTRLGG